MFHQQFSCALAIPAKAWITPGPDTVKHTAGLVMNETQKKRILHIQM